jgi:hypothetical protein
MCGSWACCARMLHGWHVCDEGSWAHRTYGQLSAAPGQQSSRSLAGAPTVPNMSVPGACVADQVLASHQVLLEVATYILIDGEPGTAPSSTGSCREWCRSCVPVASGADIEF